MGLEASCDLCKEPVSNFRSIRRFPLPNGESVKVVIEVSGDRMAKLSDTVVCNACVARVIGQ